MDVYELTNKMKKDKTPSILILASVAIIIAPCILTLSSGLIIFGESSSFVGSTIGGCTAPIVGLVSIYLLYDTLRQQTLFNKEQKSMAYDDQFKTTLFSLLEVQRDITEHISGQFENLTKTCLEEFSYKSKEGYNIISGLDFFKYSKSQIKMIFTALEAKEYYKNYNPDDFRDILESVEEQLFHGLNLPPELEEENNQMLLSVKEPQYIAYINQRFMISQKIYCKYRESNLEKKIYIIYGLFYTKYNQIGYYFRHLYRILEFIDSSERNELNSNLSRLSITQIKDKYWNYAQFIQAQMSREEMLLLFYDSFVFPKMRKLLVKYNILSNLAIQDLISPIHNCISEMHIKDMKEYLKNI